MAVQYNKDTGWGGFILDIYKAKKGIIDVSNEATNFFNKTKNWKNSSLVITDEKKFDSFIKKMNLADESLIKFLQDTNYTTKNLANYELYLKNTGKATSTFATITQKAWTVVKSLGASLASMGAMWLIGEGIGLVAQFIDSWHESEKEIKEAREELKQLGDEARNTIDEINSGFESTKSTVNEVADKYARLAQKVGSLGKIGQNQGTLSNDEYTEFLDISNQLAELFPTLTKGYDDNGNALLDLSGDVNTITSSLYDLVDAEKAVASVEIQEKMPDLFADMQADNSDYSKQFNQYTTMLNELNDMHNAWNNAKTSPNMLLDEAFLQYEDFYENLFSEAGLNMQDFYGYTFEDLANDPKTSQILDETFGKLYQEYSTKIQNLSDNIDTTNKEFGKYIVTSLQGDINYEELDEEKKGIVNSIFANLGYDTLFVNENWESASDIIQQGIIDAIKNTDNEQVIQAIQEVLSGDLSQAEFEANIRLITNFDAENGGVDYSQWLSYFDTSEIESKVNSQTQRLFDIGGEGLSQQDKNILSQYVKNLKPQEIDALEKLPISEESIKEGAVQFIVDLDKQS